MNVHLNKREQLPPETQVGFRVWQLLMRILTSMAHQLVRFPLIMLFHMLAFQQSDPLR